MKDEGIQTKLSNCQIKNNICMAIDKVHIVFPTIKLNQYIHTIEEKNVPTIAQYQNGIITLQKNIDQKSIKDYMNDREGLEWVHDDSFPDNIKDDLLYLTTPPHIDNPTGLLLHEIGHSIAQQNKDFYVKFDELVRRSIEGSFEKAIATELSVWAAFSEEELFADAFADCIFNRDKASRAGKLVPQFLKERGVI